jgi:hypothetical protein
VLGLMLKVGGRWLPTTVAAVLSGPLPLPCRHNIQRLKVATSWIPAMWGYFTELKAWVRWVLQTQ